MASDEDYASFLEKANQDPGAGTAKASGSSGKKLAFKATDSGAHVPKVLQTPTQNEDWIYISDADEPFVPVSLKIEGSKLPDEHTFASLISHPSPKTSSIEIQDVVQWDSQGQYKEVVDAVREAVGGKDVRVYRVPADGARVEYWVVGVEGGRLLGVKALAVES